MGIVIKTKANNSVTKEAAPSSRQSSKKGFFSYKCVDALTSNSRAYSKELQLYLFEGFRFILDGRFKTAYHYFKTISDDLAPLFIASLKEAMASFQDSGKLSHQDKLLSLALRLFPKELSIIGIQSDLYYQRARQERDLERALSYYQKAFKLLSPSQKEKRKRLLIEISSTCFSLGQQHHKSQSFKRAIEAYELAYKLCPNSQNALKISIEKHVKKSRQFLEVISTSRHHKHRTFKSRQKG